MNENQQTIRWGILGTARIATKVGAAIREASGAELTAIASRDAQRAADWAAEHGAARSYGSYEALLDDDQIDVVYIPLPPSLHPQWTARAAERGKHVLCEKPLAPSAAGASEMLAACEAHNVQLLDGVMWVHHPRAAAIDAVLASGRLGTLRRVTSAFTFHAPDMPLSDFRMHREAGGGSLLDLGWYCVGLTLRVFGRLPERVWATGEYENDVDVGFSGAMSFDDGATAALECGFRTVIRRWMEIAGTEGALVCDDFTRPWKPDRPRFWIHDAHGNSEEVRTEPALPIQEVWMVEEMSRLARTGERNKALPQWACETQRVCDALDKAARTKKETSLD
jgi:predicted dehydrogenase